MSNGAINSKLLDAGRRCALVVFATFLLLLCAPFINAPDHTPDREPQITPTQSSNPTSTLSKVGIKLRRGDTLASVLKRFGIAPPSVHAMIDQVRPFINPRKIRAGDDLHLVVNAEDRTVQGMEFVVDDNLVRVKAVDQGWSAESLPIPSSRATQIVRGVIKGNLYESGTDAGLSPQHIVELAKIFEYDIDFFSDFRSGDRFRVIFEEIRYIDGRIVPRRILAAELEAEGEPFSAYYFRGKDEDGSYFNRDGQALRRLFLRAPLSYARISSPYSRSRRHPIFRTLRPHLAIDYAAPAGTPVVAIGRGTVEFAGWRPGYGKVVDIRHSGNYKSRYAHFSRFAAKLRRGNRVDAGDVVGYVGQTGHATGPHLHFEFLQGGKKLNFLSLRIPKRQNLAADELPRFKELRDRFQAMLYSDSETLAANARREF